MNNSLFNLENNVVLITGATGYLGRALCIGLADLGAKVLVNSRCSNKANSLVNEINCSGGNAEPAVFDVTDLKSIQGYFDNYTGELTSIVNNAYAGGGSTIESAKSNEYIDSYDIVMVAAHNLFTKALPKLRASVKNKYPTSVINIASMYGIVSPDIEMYESPKHTNPPFYGAAKAALIQWTKYGACEFGKEDIRFNSISPGPFPNLSKNEEGFVLKLSKKVPMQRVGSADEIVGPVAFLLSSASSFVNGANISVDGGWTIW